MVEIYIGRFGSNSYKVLAITEKHIEQNVWLSFEQVSVADVAERHLAKQVKFGKIGKIVKRELGIIKSNAVDILSQTFKYRR